jgi:hypothetical protein
MTRQLIASAYLPDEGRDGPGRRGGAPFAALSQGDPLGIAFWSDYRAS